MSRFVYNREVFIVLKMEEEYDKLQKDLKENGQDHLMKFKDKLPMDQQQLLIDDLRNIKYAKINLAFQKTMAEANTMQKKDKELQPVPPEQVGSVIGVENQDNVTDWRNKGLQAIGEGKVAVLLLAGGQGTRLGVDYPKGKYDVGLPSGSTLYQLQAERILKLQELAYKHTREKATIPW